MNQYNYEIDFLPVGDGKSGDAIALRWWEGNQYKQNQKVMVIDGGTKESGQKLVEHIWDYYETDRVDYVINTHPDQDHASGLTEVLENLEVGELWIHRPWKYIPCIIDFVNNPSNRFRMDKRTTLESIRNRFSWEYYRYAKELEEIAIRKGIKIKEPYAGSKIGEFLVLSPDENWHLFDLIPNSDKTKEFRLTQENHRVGFPGRFVDVIGKLAFNPLEALGFETLRNGGKTSRENESSVVLYGNLGHGGILLTGDAGNEALERAYKFAECEGIAIAKDLKFIQIPHHGSRRNIGPLVLNRLIGKIDSKPKESITAFVSAGKNDSSHPRRVVVNAFIRRGCRVIATQGSAKRHCRGDVPDRDGWSRAEPLDYSYEVESYD